MRFKNYCAALLLPAMFLPTSAAFAGGGDVSVTGNVVSEGCTVTGGLDLTFDLDPVTKDDLPQPGAVWGRQQKNVTIVCFDGTLPHFTFAFDNDPAAGSRSVLKNSGSAQGISVEILDVERNDQPIQPGVNWAALPDDQGAVPLAVHYIRTGNMLAGSVVANAVYSINYE